MTEHQAPSATLPAPWLWLAAALAATIPTLVAYHQPPSATLLNQCLAVALWGGLVSVLPPAGVPRGSWPLLAALGLVAASVLASWGFGALPLSLALLALGLLAVAALMVVAGADAAQRGQGPAAFAALAAGLLAAGLLGSQVALLQVFAPGATDGDWIAHSGLAGRAVGNLRQPNHLCSLLLWSLVAAVALFELRWLSRAALWALAVPLVFAVELTASRTGAVGLGLLLLWALLDKRLSPTGRWLLAATPLIYALAYGAMAWYGDFSQQALGAAARVAAEGGLTDLARGADSPNSRLNIWRDALALIAAQPWAGVGFGEFNFAWSLTAFAHRPTAFFDHTHNLPLQLAVELGLPLALAVMALLLAALWQGWRRCGRARGDDSVVARAALMLVLVVMLHSQVEYPLWYAYFLLPTALAWGLLLGTPVDPVARAAVAVDGSVPGRWLGLAAGLAMSMGGALALLDYQRVVVIYAPTEGSGSLAARIMRGQQSPLFAHHADYAAATNTTPPASAELGFLRAPHSLLDTRLMMAWASHLAQRGQVDEARWLAQRLREFHNPDADEFFAPCEAAAATEFQCQAPLARHDWREFLVFPAAPPTQAAVPPLQPAAASSARQ